MKKNSTWLDRAIRFVSPTWALKRAAVNFRLDLAADYRSAEQNRLRADWVLGATDPTPQDYELEIMRERARDMSRRDPVAFGALDTMCTNIVGRGLQPQAKLRADYLGITENKAKDLQKTAENLWALWATWADAGNRLNFDELQFLALRKIVEDGEVLALPVWADDKWRPVNRAVELLEGDRLVAESGESEYGITLGSRGEPLTYHIRPAGKTEGEPMGARDSEGRPRVLHIFRTLRPGQIRGVPFFAPVLTYFKDLADYLEAEVVAARVAACLSIFVTKTDPLVAAGMMSPETDTEGKRLQHVEPGLISYLAPGEAVNVVDPKRGGETFNSFVEGLLRIIGISLGLPYELLVKDFSKTNYSSARAALLEGRRMFLGWRKWFAGKFCQPIWELVLEEAYLKGLFPAPRFYQNKTEYCRAAWIGGAWGWVDPIKEVDSDKKAIDYAFTTLADVCAAQGRDWEEVAEQRAREQSRLEDLGLMVPEGTGPEENNNAKTEEGRE
jgi:lambda family phage portal protein